MIRLADLCQFLDETLEIDGCEDSSNNGLQVEGAPAVRRAVFGVDACALLFDQAAAAAADFIFVHHGLSWKDSLKYLTGVNGRRVNQLCQNRMSLYAAHLPLDRHALYGHNKCIADLLELHHIEPYFEYHGVTIGYKGSLPEALPVKQLAGLVNTQLETESRVVSLRGTPVKQIGVVSGGAADAVEDSARAGLDCLITGEMDHAHYHLAREGGVDVISAGHYRTEVPGVKAVMNLLQERFDIDCRFIDIPTGF